MGCGVVLVDTGRITHSYAT